VRDSKTCNLGGRPSSPADTLDNPQRFPGAWPCLTFAETYPEGDDRPVKWLEASE